MGTTLARTIKGKRWWTKIGIVLMLLTGILVYQGVFHPGNLDSATNTYYFTTDTTAVNVGGDGTTNTTATLGGRISMKTGVYATARNVTAAANTLEQRMLSAYGPVYGTKQTVTAPAITIGVRDRNGTANAIYWKAYVYKYNPAVAPGAGNPTNVGAANNATLLWTSNEMEAHPSVQTPLEMTFTNPLPKDVEAGYRLKVVITARLTNTASLARLYWGNSTNYSFFTVTEANYVANSLTVTNMADYYGGALTNVVQGDTNVPMLKFDMYTNDPGTVTWTGGLLDKIGNNTTVYLNSDEPGDASFKIWKDADNDGLFETSDTLIGGPYTFSQLTGQTYALTTNQTITATPQRFFITYDILRTATPSTTVGARIVNASYFTRTGAAGGVQNVTSTSSSTPNIDYGGVAISKVYKADWDSGTSLAGIKETGGPATTNSNCVTRNTNASGYPLVGMLNYPAHSCTGVAGQGYLNASGTTQSDFARLYFGGTGYASAMKTVKGTSFTYRVSTPAGGGTVTLRLFYVTAGGVRVNAPVSSTYTTTATINQAITTSLAGQDFSNVPQGARLGIQIGVTNNVRIGLGAANGMTGSTAGANLTVQETAAENENVDVGNGVTIPNANVYASDTAKVLNAFTLTSAKAKTVTGITLTGNALFNSTNIKNVKLYQDAGTYGTIDGADTLVASLTGASIAGNSIAFTGLNESVTAKVKRYLVSVDIGDTPNVNVIVKALVSGVTVQTTGTLGNNTDSASATLTIQPTTTLTDGAAEPPSGIINAAAAATRVDAFGIKTNGGINDQINTVTVTLSTVSALPVGKVVSDFIAKVEVVNSANTVVYGYLTAPTAADNWQVATAGLSATQGTTECYVRITPKTNLGATYVVQASVTSLTHLRTINRLVLGDDDTSASVTIDGAPPANPGNFTAASATNAAAIELNWDSATDASGSAVIYRVVRGLGNAPVPKNCTPVAGKVFQVYQGAFPGTNPDVYENGLDEGQNYSYRVCTIDSVGNISSGSTAHTTAGIINRCNETPEFSVSPSASYIKSGETVQLSVAVVNNDTGTCGSASTFHLSTTGTPNTTDFDPVTFSANDFVLPTNGGSKYLKLNITAKPGAPQMAMNHFSVRVTKSGASAATVPYPDPVHVVVNKYGNMTHSSLQLGTKKYGQWGQDYDCTTCHNPNATNLKRIKDVIVTPTGPRPVVFNTVSAAQAVTTGVMGNDMRGGTTSANVCEVCHHKARFHQYSSSKVAWKTHNNSSDCMRCHDHRLGFKTVNEGLSCTDCHGNPPNTKSELVIPPTNVLFPYVIGEDAGAHPKHQARNVKCTACHSNANHPNTAQPDTKLNMGFNVWSSTFPGFKNSTNTGIFKSVVPANEYVYEAAVGTDIQPAFDKIMTCSVYCHGYWNGSYTASGGYNTEVAWSGVTQTGCSSCHGAEGASPPPSGSHPKHSGTEQGYGNGINCAVCHGFRNYSSGSSHLNGSVEWDLSSITASARYKGINKGQTGLMAPSNPATYGSCTNLYCHSNVQSANGTAGPTFYAAPVWGGTTNCGSCHQEPNLTGGHSQHTAEGVTGFDCRICHNNGGSTNSLNHANGKIDFQFGGLGDNTVYSYGANKTAGSAPYGSCSNSDCHGRATITWGPVTATSLCEKCHATKVTAAGFYGTAGPSSTKANTDPYVGAHFQHITSMPYKYSAKLDCNQCHVKPTGPYTPGHIDTALPAEINFNSTISLAFSGVQNGFSSASNQPSYNYGSKECSNVWCHGAGMNSNEGTGPYGSVGPTGDGFDGGTLGSPVPAIWNSPYLATAPDRCQTCHASPPAAPKSGYEHFDDDTGAPYARNKCTNCHRHLNTNATAFSDPAKHVNGIIDSCNVCHGRPPIDNSTFTKPVIGALSDGMVGAHQAHRLNPAIGNDCGACHYNYAYDMPSYKLEIGFRAYGNRVTRGVFWGMTTLPSVGYSQPIVYFSTWTSTKVRRTADTTKLNTCENVYCHGGGTGTVASVLGGGSNVKPNWEAGPSQAACGTCHGVTGETYRTRPSHGAHVGTGFGEPKLACNNCHGVKVNNYHVDGRVEWNFYSSAKRMNDAATAAGYVGTIGYKPSGAGAFAASGFANNLAPSASYGTCQVYCHSDPFDKTFKVPTWGGAAMTCDSCHRNQTSAGRYSGLHQRHSASLANGGYGIECTICHYGSGSGNPLHVNGSVDVIFNSTVVGVAVYDKGAKKCFSTLCHVSTASTGPTWTPGSTDGRYQTGAYQATCIGCHSGQLGTRDAVIPQFAGESHHVQTQISNGVCYQCHMEGNNDGTANVTYHDRTSGQSIDLVTWGVGSRGTSFVRYSSVSTTETRRRAQLLKVNNHCIGCHSTKNNAVTPFGDGKTPKSYAWDDRSIFERYSSIATTPWGKYTDAASTNINNKNTLNKAYSAHGNATGNQRGWAVGNGTSGETYTNTANGTVNVLCYDCHNSHGTIATGVMSSYSSATGRYKGGILKSTVNGVGGYSADYIPTAGGSSAAPDKNVYNTGAAICFDCHNNKTSSSAMPWGYNNTFGAAQPIYGYNDKPFFGNYSAFASTRTYTFKNLNPDNKGGHFGASSGLTTTAGKQINGLCTPCHDPHGVSKNTAYVSNRTYGVPLLKGTWLTSPYLQDAAPANTNEARGGTNKDSANGTTGGSSTRPARQLVGSTPVYRIDQNTFGAEVTASMLNFGSAQTARSWTKTATNWISETDSNFAGLCTNCHSKAQLAPKAGQAVAPDAWKSMSRIHGTVKGWSTTASATNGNYATAGVNKMHNFSCSKCHVPHNSRLPRLTVTNCLDFKHRGRVASTGTVSAAATTDNASGLAATPGSGNHYVNGQSGKGRGKFPIGGGMYFANNSKQQNPGTGAGVPYKWFFGHVNTTPTVNTCHDTATGGGTAGYPNNMLWNTKTPW